MKFDPVYVLLSHRKLHVPGGRYTFCVVTLVAITGATRTSEPNMYWYEIFQDVTSLENSMNRGRCTGTPVSAFSLTSDFV